MALWAGWWWLLLGNRAAWAAPAGCIN
eukprot:COSAG01_NODE_71435_length_256_cov_0.496815_1_plen_26_part_01